MTQKPQWISSAITALLILTGCTPSDQRTYERGKVALEKVDYDTAILNFKKIVDTSADLELINKSAKELSTIYRLQKKDYKQAIHYLDILQANSDNDDESQEAMKEKAFIYFYNLNHYYEAIQLYNKLLNLPKTNKKERYEFRMNLAKSHFALSQFQQARIEAERLISEVEDPNESYIDRAREIIGESLISEIPVSLQATEKYQKLLLQVQTKEIKKNMAIYLALWFEQKEKFKEAYEILIKNNDSSDSLLAQKIKQLEKLIVLQQRQPRGIYK